MNKKIAKVAALASAMVLTLSATGVAYAAETTESTETTVSTSENTETTSSATETTEALFGGAAAAKIAEFGDVQKDGKIDSKDAVKILQFYAEHIIDNEITIDEFLSAGSANKAAETTETTTAAAAETETATEAEKKFSLGDVNGDGSIDSKDAVSVLSYYAAALVGKVNVPATETTEAAESTETTAATTAVTEATESTTVSAK